MRAIIPPRGASGVDGVKQHTFVLRKQFDRFTLGIGQYAVACFKKLPALTKISINDFFSCKSSM